MVEIVEIDDVITLSQVKDTFGFRRRKISEIADFSMRFTGPPQAATNY